MIKTNEIMYKKALIYGFGPYEMYKHNITADIIGEVKSAKIAKGIIFDTRFTRSMFEQALQQYKPEVIIGLGQHSSARKIRIERRACNWQSVGPLRGSKISPGGPDFRYVNLKVARTDSSTITYEAGTYVCNYSMYLMCEYSERTGARFAFLHVPLEFDAKKAARFITNILAKLPGE